MMVRFTFLFFILAMAALGKPTIGPFLEPEAPFLSSALVIEGGEARNRVRRGLLIPLGERRWACFDTDLLRWAAVWRAPAGSPPLTLDSMAAISYPDGKAKAKSPPRLQGDLFFSNPEVPGEGKELPQRESLIAGGSGGVGPLAPDRGRWLGLELRGATPVLRYRVRDAVIEETLVAKGKDNLARVLKISPHSKALDLRIHPLFQKHRGRGKVTSARFLHLEATSETSLVILATRSTDGISFPEKKPVIPAFPDAVVVTHPAARLQGAYRIRPLAIPESSRFIRPTDFAFLSDGTGLLSTLDGDVWRIESPEAATSRWTRVASGLFETISIETTSDDHIFTLGRDQITELIDINGDHYIDHYRNASSVFQQTLQTRDYATSLAIDKDGSFLIAKGGINNNEARKDSELSAHRGTILRIAPDGDSVTVLADGLRLPYVGLRADGAVFASDQQGHFIPSTPIHLIGDDKPYLGFDPTNFRRNRPVAPLFWYPYQANRSAASFVSWDDLFLQVSWGGRLFAIETPETGQAFSWQLPLQLDFPSLNATPHPNSGRLYVTGLGISGYKPTTPDLLGIVSIEKVRPLPRPIAFDVRKRTIIVTFDRPLKEDATLLPGAPTLRTFDIKRSKRYGSPHLRWDGKPGEMRLQAKGYELSEDRRTFTLSFPQVPRAEVLDLHLSLTSASTVHPLHFFARARHLPELDPEGIKALQTKERPLVAGDPGKGKALFTTYACIGCHSLDGAALVGPTLKGIAGRADEKHLRQSILEPNAVIAEGYPAAMPSFAGVLTDQQMADLLTYLKTLR